MPTITETLAIDQQAQALAQAALDAANTAVAADQAAMAAVAPHASLWDEVATVMSANNLEHLFADIVARARAFLGV